MTNQRSTNNAEPVAWRWRDNEDEPWQDDHAWWSASRIADMRAKHRYVQPLYASPTGNSEHGGVRVKALEWNPNHYDKDGGWWYAPSTVGVYEAYLHRSGKWRLQLRIDTPPSFGDFDGLVAAKAAAQADYESRILSALEPATAALTAASVQQGKGERQPIETAPKDGTRVLGTSTLGGKTC